MKIGISISIDVTKIDKARLFKGEKGTYIDLTTFVDLDEADQYGKNGFISQSQTKDERQGGAENLPILGNCKVFWKGESTQASPQQQRDSQSNPKPARQPETDDFEDDIPF